MKKQIASLFVVVVGLAMALPGWGAASHTRSFGAQHQFHVAPKKGVSPAYDRIQARLASAEAARQERLAKMGILPASKAKPTAAGKLKPRRNSPTGGSTVGFVAATQIPAGGYMSTNPVLTGDFNGDGKTDLVTVVTTSPSAIPPSTISIAVSLGNGDGTFGAPQITTIPANSSDAFVVGDLDGDGNDDVAIVHLASSTTSSSLDIFLSNGNGTFTFNNNTVITSNDLAGGILYDMNGDGKLDVVTVDSAGQASTGVGNVWVLLGNGDGTFGAPTQTVLSNHAGSNLVFGDFNGDGLLDIADNDYTSGELSVYLGAAGMQFNARAQYPTPDGVYDGCANAVGDMTGDGKPEIVSANCNDNTLTVYLNNGDGTFAQGAYFAAATAGPGGSTPYVEAAAVAIGDVNGDGFGDVIVTNSQSGDMTVLLSNGDGTVNVPSVGYATGGGPVTPAIVTDLNGDGLADIVVTDDYYSFVYMKGFGDGTFRAAADYYSPVSDGGQAQGWDIAGGDFNGDGFADVVIGNNCCDPTVGITVMLSNGDGSFQPGVNYGSGGTLTYVTLGDFNKDGALDIAAVDTSAGTVQIFSGIPTSGVGNGMFTAGTPIATGDTGAEKIVAADLNADGWPDLVVVS
ncbi:MAG: VCBS repeat-containing protein, partial [Candidatus Sulfotelmatobacter sp.]